MQRLGEPADLYQRLEQCGDPAVDERDVCVQRAGAARDAGGGRGHYALLLHGQRVAVHDGERVCAADAEHPRPVGFNRGEQAVRGAGGDGAGPVCGRLLLLPVRHPRQRHEHRGWGRRGRQVLRLRRVRRDDGQRRYVLQRGDVHGQRCGRLRPALHERAVLQPRHRLAKTPATTTRPPPGSSRRTATPAPPPTPGRSTSTPTATTTR